MDNLFQYLESFYIPKITILDILEIGIIVIIIYNLYKTLKNTRAWVIMKGIIMLAVVYVCSSFLGLTVIETMFQACITLCLIATIILFQPEIKKFLEELGTHDLKNLLKTLKNKQPISNKKYSDKTIKDILEACSTMSEAKTGALIIIEQNSLLNEFIETGISINADISSQLLLNIFEHNTPLHDGAVIIRKDKIVAATCYLPLSDNPKINKKLGTRHRAGIGLSEVTDAIVIIVSEETGKISLVKNGKLYHGVSVDALHNHLNEFQTIAMQSETKESRKKKLKNQKEHLTHNWYAKLLSLVFGIFIWIGIISSQDPLITKNYTVDVQTINVESLSEVGKTFEILDGNKITVEVTATRSILNNLTSKDIVATADLQKLSYTYSVPVDVTIPSLSETQYDIETRNAVLLLSLDELVELNLDLQLEKQGSCEKNYYVTSITSNSKSINIVGAESLVKTIDKIIAYVDISNKKEDFTESCKIEIFDKNGSKLDNSLFQLSENEIIANGIVLPTKEIPINISFKNEKSETYNLTEYKSDLSVINIVGEKSKLEKVNEISIVIDIAKEQIGEKYIKTIVLNDYLPKDISIASDSNKLNIAMNFDLLTSKNVELNTSDIKLENLNDNLICKFMNTNVTLVFNGTEEDLEELDLSSLTYTLDLKGLSKGKYNIPLKINNLPNSITLDSNGIIPFELIRK